MITISVATGAQKLQSKISVMQAKYAARIPSMPARWAAGLAAAGAPPGPVRQAAYQTGLQGASERYAAGVQAGVGKWQRNFIEAMSI